MHGWGGKNTRQICHAVLIGFGEPYVPEKRGCGVRGWGGACQAEVFQNHRVIWRGNAAGNHIQICFFAFSLHSSTKIQAGCKHAAPAEPIKTNGPPVSLCKHKLARGRSPAAEPRVMDTDITTVFSRSLEVHPVGQGGL